MDNESRQIERLLSRVVAILNLAGSKKIADRRTFMTDLQSVYDNEQFVKAINVQSAENFKGPTSWNEIMLTVHRLAISEALRTGGESTRSNTAIALQHGCLALMRKTAKLATVADCSLDCDDLIDCIFQVLSGRTFAIYHDVYLEIFARRVLTNKSYWSKIRPNQWRQIMKIIKKLYRSDANVTKKRVIIDTMRSVVQIGCRQSHLALDTKKLLPFLEKIFHENDLETEESLSKALYNLAHVVCQQIGTESRTSLRSFSEKIIPSMIHSNPSPEKFTLLLLLLRINHPGGVKLDDDASRNRDRQLWKNIIAEIHGNVIKQMKITNLQPCFWELCCEVYRQIIEDPTLITEASSSRSSDGDDEQPRKRRRLLMTVSKPHDLLITNDDSEVAGPFVKILTVLIKRYPNCLKSDDYPTFLKTIEEFAKAWLKNQTLMDSLMELCTVVVKIEKKYFYVAEQVTNVRACWRKICDTVLRLLSGHQNETAGYKLIQSIIVHNNVLDANEFLQIYLKTQNFRSCTSVETLLTFCSHVALPNGFSESGSIGKKPNSSTRLSLLNWTLKHLSSNSFSNVSPTTLANLLTAIATKFSHEREFRDFINHHDRAKVKKSAAVESLKSELFDNRESKCFNDIERCLLSMEFRENKFQSHEESTKILANLSTVVVRDVFESLIAKLIELLTNSTNDRKLTNSIKIINVVAKLMSNFYELNVRQDDAISRIFDAFEQSYENILSRLMTMKDSRSLHHVDSLENLNFFYQTHYHPIIAKKIHDLTTMDFIIHIYKFVPEDDEDSENDENSETTNFSDSRGKKNCQTMTNVCRLRNSSHNILTSFCCCRVNDEITANQMRVLKNLLKPEIYELSNIHDQQRALMVLKYFGESELSNNNVESFKIVGLFLQGIFETQKTDEIVVRGLLKILPNYVKFAAISLSNENVISNILGEIYESLDNEKFGPLVHVDFVKCLTEFIPSNPFFKLKIFKTNEESSITEIFVIYINNPFYVVRLEIVRAICEIFTSDNYDVPWKTKYFGKILSSMEKLFSTVDEIIDEKEKMDQLATRTSTSLHILVEIIRSNEYFQTQSLWAIVEFSVSNNVKIWLVKQALLSVTNNDNHRLRMMEINSYELLSRWLKIHNSINDFPWTLVDCQDHQDFAKKHTNILLTIKLENFEIFEFANFCEISKISFSRIIENYFPSVMTILLRQISTPNRNDRAEEIFRKLRSNFDEFSEIENYKVLLLKKLPDIILDVITRLHDRDHLCEMTETNFYLPKVNCPNLKVEIIEKCLRRLKMEISSKDCSLMKYFVDEEPKILQTVCSTLFRRIIEAETIFMKILEFHRWIYFYKMIIDEISLSHFDQMSFHIVRDVVHSLLILIEANEKVNDLAEMACSYFLIFLEKALPARVEDLKLVLRVIVSKLIPIVQSGRPKNAIKIIRSLIIDHQATINKSIAKLDEFPNDSIFDEFRDVHKRFKYHENEYWSFTDEIEHYLDGNRDDNTNCNLEGLKIIRRQLSTRKTEVEKLYKNVQFMFEDSSTSTVLRRFICKLLSLGKSNDKKISHEALMCLGELGPANLGTIALHSNHENCHRETIEQVEMLTYKSLKILNDYLTDKNMNLRSKSSEALYKILSTKWGSQFVDKTIVKNFTIIDKSPTENLYECIYPFFAKNLIKWQPIVIDDEMWNKFVAPSNDLWIGKNCDNYDQWLSEITCNCLDCFVNFYGDALKPICRLSVEFCEMLMPRLFNLIAIMRKTLIDDICSSVNRFFRFFVLKIGSSMNFDAATRTNDFSRDRCLRCMLEVVNFMRIQSIDGTKLNFDYLFVAKAAQYFSAWFTSIFYAELWCEQFLRRNNLTSQSRSWTSRICGICEFVPDDGTILQEIVRDAYVHIGDPDCLDGCGLSYLIRSSFKTQYYGHLERWKKVTLAHDVALTCGRNNTRGMLNALKQSGQQYLLKCMINKANKEMENVDDFMYETAWRLADWNIIEINRRENLKNLRIHNGFDYHASHYHALQSLSDNDTFRMKIHLDNARDSIVQSLRIPILECTQTLYPILSKLQMLREIEEFATNNSNNRNKLIDNWNQRDFMETHDFHYVEAIFSQRLVMYGMRNLNDNSSIMRSTVADTHLKMAEVAEDQGYLPIAYRVLGNLARKNDLDETARDQLTYQKALLDWTEKDHYMGRLVLRNLLLKSTLNLGLRGKAQRVYGNWMAETASEGSENIVNKYRASIVASEEAGDLKTLMGAQSDLAQFADAQYRQIVEFTKTAQYESLIECRRMKNDGERSLQSGRVGRAITSATSEVERARHKYQLQLANDVAELDGIDSSKNTYLLLAARYYLTTLMTSNDHDLLVYPVISLWLDNSHHEELNRLIESIIPKIGSHKFVALLPQLVAHMSNVSQNFSDNINEIVKRCAEEHPHHTLPILLAIDNTRKDHEFGGSLKDSQTRSKMRLESRLIAVDVLISKLGKSKLVGSIINEMRRLYDALIILAHYKVPEAEAKKLPTVTLDVRPSGNYNNIVGIMKYENTFEVLGRTNGSKKIICVDKSGKRWRQLLKAEHDLRQEAIVQQVCTTMNSMLMMTRETKRRKLRVRTYNIVPLSRRSGVIEWCSNAQSMSNILCDTEKITGLHAKYYPNDWSVAKCGTKLREVQDSSVDVKLKNFLECCEHFRPAFHHYFTEKYPSAEMWFEKRLAYVRSVATSSMIGYMLGLGDRSCENILIDQTTAEVIHIDIGLASSELNALSRPETVPFRLTRDMEAAMGICGVEGVMKNCCEHTVNVLRERRKTLMTLLQVVVHDPLLTWTSMSPEVNEDLAKLDELMGCRRPFEDNGDETAGNEIARKALLKIEEKLEGTEDAVASSICGQVERLIQEARDPANLCRMIHDWQPYL